MRFTITGDPAADAVLDDPFALVAAMMLDQQFPMERAFAGPAVILDRLGSIDPRAIADTDPEQFAALCARPPAVHRYPGAMAGRLQDLARHVVTEYDADASALWEGAGSAADLKRRVAALPGFGPQKTQIFVALLAKRLDVRPEGWETVAGDYALEGYRSVADVVDSASLQRVRAYKQERKAAAKAART